VEAEIVELSLEMVLEVLEAGLMLEAGQSVQLQHKPLLQLNQ
jgi:hypothetical protein